MRLGSGDLTSSGLATGVKTHFFHYEQVAKIIGTGPLEL
jgi:hypothetical protein